jgi:Formamidopyrimidine-DNA glycosylase
MPEGPSIVILREEVQTFTGQKILRAEGNSTKIDKARLVGQRIVAFRSWGKHFLIELDGFALRIHFLLFGSYRVNERKDRPARLSLSFAKGELNFYSCSVRYIEGELDDIYDWRTDVMSDQWDAARARKKVRAAPETPVCDALLDQNVFAGVGNIIKNECCSGCAFIRFQLSARCLPASCASWSSRRANTVSSSSNGRRPTCSEALAGAYESTCPRCKSR